MYSTGDPQMMFCTVLHYACTAIILCVYVYDDGTVPATAVIFAAAVVSLICQHYQQQYMQAKALKLYSIGRNAR